MKHFTIAALTEKKNNLIHTHTHNTAAHTHTHTHTQYSSTHKIFVSIVHCYSAWALRKRGQHPSVGPNCPQHDHCSGRQRGIQSSLPPSGMAPPGCLREERSSSIPGWKENMLRHVRRVQGGRGSCGLCCWPQQPYTCSLCIFPLLLFHATT